MAAVTAAATGSRMWDKARAHKRGIGAAVGSIKGDMESEEGGHTHEIGPAMHKSPAKYKSPAKEVGVTNKQETYKMGGVGNYGTYKGMPYTPFKMAGTPMKRNFGIGETEGPDDVSKKTGVLYKSESPAKFFGAIGRMFKRTGIPSPGQLLKKATGIEDPMDPAMQAEAAAAEAQDAAAEGGAVEGGGEVPMHGPESHTGGGGPIGRGGIGGAIRGIGGAHRRMMGFGRRAVGGIGRKISSWFSDVRLKENIEKKGVSPSGIPIYEFNYIGDNTRYSGVMAQDLLGTDAVSKHESGYYMVDYDNIDVDIKTV